MVDQQPQIVQLSPESEAKFQAFAQKAYDHWKTVSQEDQEKDKALMNSFKANPASAMERFNECLVDFDAADADGDGNLNLAEYTEFIAKQQRTCDERGEIRIRHAGYVEESYALFNSVDPSKEGFDKDQWTQYLRKMKTMEYVLMQADGHYE